MAKVDNLNNMIKIIGEDEDENVEMDAELMSNYQNLDEES